LVLVDVPVAAVVVVADVIELATVAVAVVLPKPKEKTPVDATTVIPVLVGGIPNCIFDVGCCVRPNNATGAEVVDVIGETFEVTVSDGGVAVKKVSLAAM